MRPNRFRTVLATMMLGVIVPALAAGNNKTDRKVMIHIENVSHTCLVPEFPGPTTKVVATVGAKSEIVNVGSGFGIPFVVEITPRMDGEDHFDIDFALQELQYVDGDITRVEAAPDARRESIRRGISVGEAVDARLLDMDLRITVVGELQ